MTLAFPALNRVAPVTTTLTEPTRQLQIAN